MKLIISLILLLSIISIDCVKDKKQLGKKNAKKQGKEEATVMVKTFENHLQNAKITNGPNKEYELARAMFIDNCTISTESQSAPIDAFLHSVVVDKQFLINYDSLVITVKDDHTKCSFEFINSKFTLHVDFIMKKQSDGEWKFVEGSHGGIWKREEVVHTDQTAGPSSSRKSG